MEVQVVNALPRLLPDVGHHAVALQTQLLRQLGNDLKNVGHYGAVFRRDSGNRGNVGLGNHQKVYRGLGCDVIKGIAQIVLIDLVAGNFPAPL